MTLPVMLLMVVIISFAYMYYDHKSTIEQIESGEVKEGGGSIIGYAVLGGICAFILQLILKALLGGSDTESSIFIGIVALSAIICGCTACIVRALKDNK